MLDILLNPCFSFNRKNIKINSEFIYFNLVLSYGKLNDNDKIRCIINKKINRHEMLYKLDYKLRNVCNVRIWYNCWDNEELCNMYYLINYLSKYNINIYLININLDEFSSITYNLINKSYLLNEETKSEIKNKWLKLLKEDADIRVIRNNTLCSCSFEILDKLILDELVSKIQYSKFIAKIYLKKILNINDANFLEARVHNLIITNKIIVEKEIINNIEYLYLQKG